MARQLVCIPTYNEADNILALVEQIHQAAPELDVLVIDDASPDGTGDLVRDRMLKDAHLEVITTVARPRLESWVWAPPTCRDSPLGYSTVMPP